MEVDAPVVETPAVETPTAAPAPVAPTGPETLHDTVAKAVEKSSERGKHAQHQPRKETGQFAGPPKFPVPPAATPDATATVAAPQRPDMPKSLKLELKQHWDAAHPELAAAIYQRELDQEKGVMPLKQAKAQLDEILNEFKPYEMLLRTENATPKQAIAPLLQTAAILRTGTPAQKAQAVAQTMQQFGISLEHVQQLLSSGNPPTQPAIDPQLQMLTQQVQQLTQQQQAQLDARGQQAVQKFMADPANKHIEAVWEQMLVLLENPKTLGPQVEVLSETEKLKLAYESAIWQVPAVRTQILAEQQAKELADRQAAEQVTAQARNSAVQVTGAPRAAPASQVNVRDLHAVVENAIRRNQR